jgi:hypothetical protein
MFQVFQTYVLSVLFGCRICCIDYIRMLQAYVSCCKRMYQVFQVFQTYVLSVSSRCCIYMHVASVCFKVFQVFHTHVVSVSS